MAEASYPLTQEDLGKINDALDAASQAAEVIKKAKRANIDVSAEEKALADSTTKLREIKRVFFPGQ